MITTPKMAYRAGFASGFTSNSNEILERRKFEFAEVSVREEKKMRDEFHKGYFLCQELVRKINVEKAINDMPWNKLDVIVKSEIIEVKPVIINKENIFEVLDNLIYNSDLRKMKDILSRQGYSGIDF